MNRKTSPASKPANDAAAVAALAERFWTFQCHEPPLTSIQAQRIEGFMQRRLRRHNTRGAFRFVPAAVRGSHPVSL